MRRPFEGWILEAPLAGIVYYWIVKGYYHPPGMLIAVPYRAKGASRLETLPERSPQASLSWVGCLSAEVPATRDTGRLIDPRKSLEVRAEDLPEIIHDLIGIAEPSWSGLTGSWAVAEEGRASDVDLLIHFEDIEGGVERLRRALERLGFRGCLGPRSEWPGLRPKERVTEVCRGGLRVTIRVLEKAEGAECYTPLYVPAGRYNGIIMIEGEASKHGAITVPARYRFRGIGLSGVLETWRTSFQELPKGLYRAKLLLRVEVASGDIVATPDYGGRLELLKAQG